MTSLAHEPERSTSNHLELVATEVAVLAARFVRSQFGGAVSAGTKSTDTDVVTHTDMASEDLVRVELARRCPGSTIVGEEAGRSLGSNNVGWIVDPIDGTVNFLYGLPVVSVSIAATLGGQVVAGAVTDVLSGETFCASIGNGATCDGAPIFASGANQLGQALVGTGFAYDAGAREREAQLLTKVLPVCRDIRCMGSAALNLCWVAAGRLDGFYERSIQTYDYAAGALIAAEAGASVELPAANETDLTLAAAPEIFPQLSAAVANQPGPADSAGYRE